MHDVREETKGTGMTHLSEGGTSRPSTPPSSGRKSTFRGDIQGLRAIAVLTVIAGHAGLQFVPGGFVGVDVFFVISGFLISLLLFAEVDRSNRVSIRDFYARRARRILPAATLVILVTLGASLLWASAIDALDVVDDALWATFFAANIHFFRVGTDYFAQEEGPSPLQHYWSLSVEEQFYLVWPLLLLCCVLAARALARRRGRRRAPAGLPRLTVFTVLVVLTTASFVYGAVLTAHNPTSAYFSTPARAWELGLGALTALVAGAVASRLKTLVRALLCLAGLGLIAFACVSFDASTAFPGLAALVPTVGSALILLAGAGGHDWEPWPIQALALKPMRVIGDWSYSLYLWHWPLLIVPSMAGHPLSTAQKVLAVIATFLLAALTYRFVETPFRDARRMPRPRAFALYPATATIVAACCLIGQSYAQTNVGGDGEAIAVDEAALSSQGIKVSRNETIALVQASVVAAQNGAEIPANLRPSLLDLRGDVGDVGECNYMDSDLRRICPRGDVDADKTIVLLGNSHARMWIPAFDRIAEAAGYRTYYFAKPNCTGADLAVSDADASTPPEPWEGCIERRKWAIDEIEKIHPDLAVVSTTGPNPYVFTEDGRTVTSKDEDWNSIIEEGFYSIFEKLQARSERVALLRDSPKGEEEPDTCLTRPGATLGDCLFTPKESSENDADASVRAADRAGIDVVDPRPWLCWRNTCPVVIGDMLSYRDRGHLTTVYSRELADEVGRKLKIWDGEE